MDFLGIGLGPVVVLVVLVLVFFGPSKLPETVRTVGRYTRAFKKMSSELTEAISKEIDISGHAGKTGGDSKRPTFQEDHEPPEEEANKSN